MLITPANLQFAFNMLDLRFQQGYTLAESFYREIATEMPSNTEQNVYGWIGKLPKMREWVGERVFNNAAARSYTLVNKTFEDSLKIPREKFEDDQYGIYGPMAQMLGEEALVLPDRLIAGLLDKGDAATSLTFDGQPFFSTTHPTDPDNAASGSQSNLVTGSTMTAANVAANYAKMRLFQGEDGLPLGIKPTHLVVGPSLEMAARQICNTTFIAPAGAQFGLNAASVMQENPVKVLGLKPLVVDWLDQSTSTTQGTWYLLDCRKVIKPFIWQVRRGIEATWMASLTDANVFLRKEFLYGLDLRAAAGYSLWFMAMKMIPS